MTTPTDLDPAAPVGWEARFRAPSIIMPAIIAAGDAIGGQWFIAEQDEPRVVLDDIASAYPYLSAAVT